MEQKRKFTFNKKAEPVSTCDFFYDLFRGGYIRPDELLTDPKDKQDIAEAMNLINAFEQAMVDANLIKEM